MKVRLTLLEELLGTKSANKDVFADFIASKAPDDDARKEELDSAEHREEAGTTIFSVKDGVVGIYDYQVKGFFKEIGGFMNRFDKEFRGDLDKLTAHKSHITGSIHVTPRFIPLMLPPDLKLGLCERPLKADTAQGPRVALVRSESIPVGSTIEFEIKIMEKSLKPYVKIWLDQGEMNGMGQWRSSGKGRFTWQDITPPVAA